MTPVEADAILFVTGVVAGIVSAVVGNGTTVVFPVLLFTGVPPLAANVTTAVALLPGSASAGLAMRQELRGQYRRLLRLGVPVAAGSLLGAILLLVLPAATFAAATPALITVAILLVVVQPYVKRWLRAHHPDDRDESESSLLWIVGGIGVYTGYFGSGAGLIFYAVLGVLLAQSLQRSNALKVVLVLIANTVASAVFLVASAFAGSHIHIVWSAALAVALGSIGGGVLGARIGRVLPEIALRCLIIAVGLGALIYRFA